MIDKRNTCREPAFLRRIHERQEQERQAKAEKAAAEKAAEQERIRKIILALDVAGAALRASQQLSQARRRQAARRNREGSLLGDVWSSFFRE